MKKAIVLVMAMCAAVASAQIVDDFDSYATGPLSVVSGGVWNTWGGVSTDAQVVDMGLSPPNAMYHDGVGVPDVVSYSPVNLFSGMGSVVTVGFDFLTHEVATGGNPDGYEDMDTYFFIGSGNPGDLSIDYASCFGAFIVDWVDIDGVGASPLHIWDIAGATGGGDYGVLELARGLPSDVWHNVQLVATQTVPDMTANDPNDADGTFDVFVNGGMVADDLPFGMDNPLGMNAVEVYSFEDEQPEPPDDYHLFDSISLVPEPGALLLLVLGAIVARRR
jgi:hypothetical protein